MTIYRYNFKVTNKSSADHMSVRGSMPIKFDVSVTPASFVDGLTVYNLVNAHFMLVTQIFPYIS